ncbi:hypothetical protein E4U43_008051 [Claviceps pusilla]|uniref:Acetylesterase n=1 Tax=Claviceps pusilla TaxID=123648 RepID=A0A9P7NDV6_9HYPO|nr:hypothetical protein E4U43_008051 [Claviceps pusilla]
MLPAAVLSAVLAATAATAAAMPAPASAPASAPAPAAVPVHLPRPGGGVLQNLVTFGNSYTDEGRFAYFVQNHRAPPPGEMLPPSNSTASGGASWARFVANATGAGLYNYAVSGAQCTNNIDARTLDAAPFPSLLEYQVSAFEHDLSLANASSSSSSSSPKPPLYPHGRHPDNTLYAFWIGTNDVGIDGFLGDRNKPNTTLTTFLDCTWHALDAIHRTGGRHFVLLNLAPLPLAPMYASPGESGTGNHEYWRNKTAYPVEQYARKLQEYTTSVNSMWRYGAGYYLSKPQQRWPGASLSIFDVHALVLDVVADPAAHLDQPANVRSPFRTCLDGCVEAKEPKTSFMWYDELHPSERMHTIFAKHFIDVVQGRSKYGIYYK